MKSYTTILVAVLFVSCFGLPCFAACPSADLTGDCLVNFNDFAVMAAQWMMGDTPYPTLSSMTWVTISDPGDSCHGSFHGDMSKYETTNAQYCQFLNAALASGDITVSGNSVLGKNGLNPGADFVGRVYYNLAGPGYDAVGISHGGAARINYTGSSFTVDYGFDNHPVTYVSWHGATAFCNYYGWRLPADWEWQAVADYTDNRTYACGMSITTALANYHDTPAYYSEGTRPVGSFGSFGYGLCDMAGNVCELMGGTTSNGYRGGSWTLPYVTCAVSWFNSYYDPSYDIGFRACR